MDDFINTKVWQRYIENEIGFVLPIKQERWLNNAISATAKKNNMTVSELWSAVQTDIKRRQQLLDAALIIESRFFRHLPSLNYAVMLAKKSVPALSGKSNIPTGIDRQPQLPFRVWSVGCASGQEVWSLVMMLEEDDITDYAILGTDVNLQAIKRAQRACYRYRELRAIPAHYHKYIQADDNITSTDKYWRLADSLRPKVTFKYHNIFTHTAPTHLKQQVILCQNMLIYFRQFDQRDILARLVDQCELGGHLILAPGEALFWQHPKMQRIRHREVNAWQKIEV